jgi:hypothetical protein
VSRGKTPQNVRLCGRWHFIFGTKMENRKWNLRIASLAA